MSEDFDASLVEALAEVDSDNDFSIPAEESSKDASSSQPVEDEEDVESVEDEYEDEEEEGEEEEEDSEEIDPQLQLMQEMRDELVALRKERDEKGEKEAEEKAEADSEAEIDFVTDEQFDTAVTDREGFNRVMNDVFRAGQQAMLQSIPGIVKEQVDAGIKNAELVSDFYRSNPDLAQVKPLVQNIVAEVVRERGEDADPKKALVEVAKRARSRMPGSKKSKRNVRGKGALNAGGTKAGSGKPRKKGKATVASELESMMGLDEF